MTFLRVNNLDVSAMVDGGFTLADVSAEPYVRAPNDDLVGVSYRRKRELRVTTDLLSASEANALEGWARGDGHLFSWDRLDSATTRFSRTATDGGARFAAPGGTSSTLSTTAKFGTHSLLIAPGSLSSAVGNFGEDAEWSISAWTKDGADPWKLHTRAYSAATTISYENDTTVATTGMFSIVSSASGTFTFSLVGRAQDGTSATMLFDHVMVVPYCMTAAMVAARSSATVAEARFPYVNVSGDALPNPNQTIEAKGFTDSFDHQPVVLNGSWAYNARRLGLRLLQR